MNRVIVLAIKDLKLMSRDRLGMFFMLVFPVIMALFFGSIMGGFGQSGSQSLRLIVSDEDHSTISQSFVDSLTQNDSVDIVQMERSPALDSVRKGHHAGVIILPEGFGETAGVFWQDPPHVELGLDPSRKAESGMIQGLVMRSMGQLMAQRFEDTDAMKSLISESRQQLMNADDVPETVRPVLTVLMDSVLHMLDSLETVQKTTSEEESNTLAAGSPFGNFNLVEIEQIDVSRQPEPGSHEATMQKLRSGWDISFPQSMVWAIMACVAGFATLIVREQTIGTQTRLLVAPLSRPQLLAAKALACFVCLFMVLSFITLIATAAGMRPLRWDLLALAFASIGVCFVGMMLPLSLLGKTEQSVSGAVWGVCTLMAMFGGGMIPVVFMPKFVRTISNFDPVAWAVYAVEGAIWRGFSFTEMLIPCGILCGIGLASAALGAWMISRRQW